MNASAPPPPPTGLPRRHWLALAGLASAAGLTGHWAWQSQQAPQNHAVVAGDALPPAFWQHTFPTPSGGTLSMGQFKGQPCVINFWATWCPPCVKEIPLLDQFSQRMAAQGWHVIGLAVDQAPAVLRFLAHTPVHFSIALADNNGLVLAQQLGNGTGGLPFSLVIDRTGRVRARKMGPVHAADLAQWVAAIDGS